MSSVSIVGAGEIGGAVARALAARERFRRIRLIDDAANVAAGKALDIRQAGPIESYDAQITGDAELSSAVDAAVVVVADGAAGGEWTGDALLMKVRRLIELGVGAPLVFAGAGARDAMERIAVELSIDRARLIGSAPEALASAIRAFTALEANGSPADVYLSVVGVPPGHVAVPWSDASIGGYSAPRVLDASAIARIDRRIPALWPPGPHSLGAAAARIAEATAFGSLRVFNCFAVLDARGTTAAVTVTLGARGVERLVTPTLDPRERVVFDNSVSR
jgi:malate dehydrogenase